jgi:hypothetical protein
MFSTPLAEEEVVQASLIERFNSSSASDREQMLGQAGSLSVRRL